LSGALKGAVGAGLCEDAAMRLRMFSHCCLLAEGANYRLLSGLKRLVDAMDEAAAEQT
jgi:hypothetical protein